MKRKILLALLFISIAVIVVISARKERAFSAAEDFPRAPLFYAQVTDLPVLIKTLKASGVGAKYIDSQNYSEFLNRHLGRKLASRWKEFNEGVGFDLDLETIAGFADNRAAVAVYDIGKLEFVFAAPISDELFAATMLVKNAGGRFTSAEHEGGVTVYRASIDADRGRQKQELLFTNIKGRLVIATSEKLLVRTINNISGRSSNDRLTDDPAFNRLRETLSPHTFTVWINQTALNSDYYFKRYWLMGSVADLKNYEAALCDFSFEEGGVIEDRRFLLKEPSSVPDIAPRQVAAALVHLPANIPYFRLRNAMSDTIAGAINQTINDRNEAPPIQKKESYRFSDDAYEYDYGYYGSLDSRFDTAIDEVPDDAPIEEPLNEAGDLRSILDSAHPESVLTFTRPGILPAPLFAEFKRGAVFHLGSPAGFDRARLETAIRDRLLKRVTVTTDGADITWTAKGKNGGWRQLDLPMLAWSVCYAIRGNDLFLANDPELLTEALEAKNRPEKEENGLSERSVLLVPETAATYDPLFGKLAAEKPTEDLFNRNIKSLFESMPGVKRIEFERSYSGEILREKVLISIK